MLLHYAVPAIFAFAEGGVMIGVTAYENKSSMRNVLCVSDSGGHAVTCVWLDKGLHHSC